MHRVHVMFLSDSNDVQGAQARNSLFKTSLAHPHPTPSLSLPLHFSFLFSQNSCTSKYVHLFCFRFLFQLSRTPRRC
jgi:hypothetical protein